MNNNVFVILGNQLFHPKKLKSRGCNHVIMIEDYGLCTFEKHHKLKLYLFLCAMREFKDELEQANIKVTYFKLEDRTDNLSYTDFLTNHLQLQNITLVNFFEIEDSWFESQIIEGVEAKGIAISFHQTPMFLFSRQTNVKASYEYIGRNFRSLASPIMLTDRFYYHLSINQSLFSNKLQASIFHKQEQDAYVRMLLSLSDERTARDLFEVSLRRKGMLLKVTSETQQVVLMSGNSELRGITEELTETRKKLAGLTLSGEKLM